MTHPIDRQVPDRAAHLPGAARPEADADPHREGQRAGPGEAPRRRVHQEHLDHRGSEEARRAVHLQGLRKIPLWSVLLSHCFFHFCLVDLFAMP